MKKTKFCYLKKHLIILGLVLLVFTDILALEYAIPRIGMSIDYGDIDLDNDLDIVVSCYYSSIIPDTIAILINDGTGYFTVNYLEKETTHFLKCFKVDNDDLPDLVTKIMEDYQFVYYHNNGDGSFAEAVSIHSTVSNYEEEMVVSDINNDGDNDIVFWNTGFDSYWGILHNNGNGGFTEIVYYNTDTWSYYLDTGKIDNDEYDDVLLITEEEALIFFNDLPNFIPTIIDTSFYSYIYCLDMDNDGDNDVCLYDPWYNMSMFYNEGDGTFNDIEIIDFPSAVEINDINDFNNDGYPDFVYHSDTSANDSIYVVLNDQNGDFSEPSHYFIGHHPTYFISCSADFDNNGYNDLAITGYGIDFTHGGVSILFNDGTGNFVGEPQIGNAECKIENVKCKISNYPNPFNPTTNIEFSIPEQGLVEINIYDIKGRLVKKLISKILEGGEYEAIWDGRNKDNRSCSTGIYLMNLMYKGITQKTGKLVLMK